MSPRIGIGIPDAPSLWTPNFIAGASVYDPARYAAGALANMSDSSSRAANFLQSNAALKPVVVATGGPNDQPRITWNTQVVSETTGKFAAFTEFEMIVVRKLGADPPGAGTGQGGCWDFHGGAAAQTFTPFTDGGIYESSGTTVRKTCGNPAAAMTDWHIIDIISTASEYTVRVGGVEIFTTGVNVVGLPAVNCHFGAGNATALTYWMVGETGLAIISNHKLTTTERQQWTAYALARWGLAA